MRNNVWIMRASEVNFYKSVLTCFDADFFDIQIATQSPADKELGNFLSGDGARLSGTAELQDLGFFCREFDADTIKNYENIVLNANFLSRKGPLNEKVSPETHCVALKHSLDMPIFSYRLPAHWYIGASQRQIEIAENGKVPRSQTELFTKIMEMPIALRNEYAYSGPYHLGEWVTRRHNPKAVLQQELEAFLGCTFDATKPVVAFLQDEFCHEQQVLEGLARLTEHVNLVVKAGPRISALPGVFAYPPSGFAPNLLRFAADFILAGYHSGTLASSIVLGLPVVPFYTTMIIWKGGVDAGKRKRYTVYLERQGNGDNICIDILEQINPPVNLQDTEAVLERMNNTSWWKDYTCRLPVAQRRIFGDYTIEDATEKTAQLIKNVFSYGTFGEDVAAVRVRPGVKFPV